MNIGDRTHFQGYSFVIEDTDDTGAFPRVLVRYATTNRTEWIAADAVAESLRLRSEWRSILDTYGSDSPRVLYALQTAAPEDQNWDAMWWALIKAFQDATAVDLIYAKTGDAIGRWSKRHCIVIDAQGRQRPAGSYAAALDVMREWSWAIETRTDLGGGTYLVAGDRRIYYPES